MPLPFNGAVVSITLRPAPGVTVRVFDIDNPEQASDELTLSPAVSGPGGNFSLLFEPLLAVDTITYTTEVVWYEPANPPFDWRPVRRTRIVTAPGPDLSDTFDPALDFNYVAAGRPSSVRRRGFFSPATLPHIVGAEPVTWPAVASVAHDSSGREVLCLRANNQTIWVVRGSDSCAAQQLPRGSDQITPFRVGINKDSRLEVFGRHSSGALHHCWEIDHSGQWSNFASLGGQVADRSPIEVVANHDGRLEIFVRWTDGSIRHISQQADFRSWSGWRSLGGQVPIGGTIAAIKDKNGCLNICYNGMDNKIWTTRQQSPGHSTWLPHAGFEGAFVTGPLAIGTNQDGRLEIFSQGRDGDILHIWQLGSGGWSAVRSLGGIWVAGSLAVANHADGRLAVIAQGTNRNVFVRSQSSPNAGWSSWVDLGRPINQGWTPPVPPSDPITIGRRHNGTLFLIWRDADGTAYRREQNGPNASWGNWGNAASVPPPPPLNNPFIHSAAPYNRAVRLQWSNIPGAERYVVRWRRTGASDSQSATTQATVHDVINLDNGVEYEFWVVAENRCHHSESNHVRATPVAKPDLAAGSLFCSEAVPKSNIPFTISGSVTNVGTAPTAASFKCQIICHLPPDASGNASTQIYPFPPIPAGFMPAEVRQFEWTHQREAGDYYYLLQVDYEGSVANELDEGNNVSGAIGVVVTD